MSPEVERAVEAAFRIYDGDDGFEWFRDAVIETVATFLRALEPTEGMVAAWYNHTERPTAKGDWGAMRDDLCRELES